MESKKSNEWIIFLISAIVLGFAYLFPAVSYENQAGYIHLYLSGIVSITIYGYETVTGYVSSPEIMIPSTFAMYTIGYSLISLLILSYYLKKDIKNFKKLNLRYFLLINAVLLLIPTIAWIIQYNQVMNYLPQEIIDMGYETIWEILTPSFGLVGVFLCSGIIFGGVAYIQLNYVKILEKLLPARVDKRKELNMLYRGILCELDQITNNAKKHYFEEKNDSILLETLTKEEFRKYSRLNQRLDKLSSILQKKPNNDKLVFT